MSKAVPVGFRFLGVLFTTLALWIGGAAVVARDNLEVRLQAATMEYTNPTFLESFAYVRVSRKARTKIPVFNAFFPFRKDIPLETNISWHCFQKINNAWRSTILRGSASFCGMIESKNKLQRMIFDFSDMPSKCPVKKGNYSFKDFYIRNEVVPQLMPTSEIKARCTWGTPAQGNIMVYSMELKINRKSRSEIEPVISANSALAVNKSMVEN